ncbi:MAG: flavodoxin [Candidatus Cryptobacteroides sp.]
MNRKNRYFAFVLAAFMVASLAACGGNGNSTQQASPGSSQGVESADSQTEAPDFSDSKILIAYFTADENTEVDAVTSASVTTVGGIQKGRVRAVADMIAEETGGDLFSIQTSVQYPADGGALIDYAAQEQDDNVRPELTSHIEDLEDYDIIFVGYPNWWYDMPMVLYSFFDEYDFSGKTIIPFNVHNGSRFSGTIDTIHELEPNATVVTDGFTVSERNVADAARDVADWLDGLGF